MPLKDINAHVGYRGIARKPSRHRFMTIGILLITTIIVATAALIWMQRNDAIAAYGTATTNLGNAGDQLLCETAQRLKSSLRDTDVLARLGGDEFAIIQSGEENPREGAAGLAARILKLISEPFDIDGHVVFVGSSIGIALAPENSGNSSDLLKMADLALYAVKEASRNNFRFASVARRASTRSG